jgi:cytosine/adenosine deaminase-related metal-dependent hydrolase
MSIATERLARVSVQVGQQEISFETGKLADILVLDADPLADIHNIRKLSLVMRDGRIIDRDRLPEKPVWTRSMLKP